MEIHLEKRDPEKNQARYYRMSVLPNLFGEWTLHREWGRIGQGGRTRLDLFPSETEAEHAFRMMKRAKQLREYDRADVKAVERCCFHEKRLLDSPKADVLCGEAILAFMKL